MNLPNKLSCLRIILVPVMALIFLLDFAYCLILISFTLEKAVSVAEKKPEKIKHIPNKTHITIITCIH